MAAIRGRLAWRLGEVDESKRWTWEEFSALPSEEITTDIHCVT